MNKPAEWIDRLRKLHTPVIADVLDKLGFRNQCMNPLLRPLFPTARLAGFALTVQTSPASVINPAHPYAGELTAVDALKENDVMVVSECEFSFWGELLSTSARFRGSSGIVIDGYTRDSQAITQLQFPVFCRGCHPADSLGRLEVVAHNVPIHCGGVFMAAGDLILADSDGIVVVPNSYAEQALALAEEKIRGENLVRAALEQGMSTTEAFATFGIL